MLILSGYMHDLYCKMQFSGVEFFAAFLKPFSSDSVRPLTSAFLWAAFGLGYRSIVGDKRYCQRRVISIEAFGSTLSSCFDEIVASFETDMEDNSEVSLGTADYNLSSVTLKC
jgi:hypothetical protein